LIIAGIPAYNEDRTIAEVVLKTLRYVDVVIVCDDGSTDMTAEIAEKLGAKVVRHEKNMGKGFALKTLLAHALKLDPSVIVTLDADGQHDPSEIQELIKPIKDGKADVVIGSRFVGESMLDMSLYRKMGLRAINWLGRRASKSKVIDTQSGFRAYSPKAAQTMAVLDSSGYGVELEQLAAATENRLKVVEIPATVKYKGLENTSKKHPLMHGQELISTILRMVVEERPLVFLGVPGVLSLFVGVLFGVWMLQLYAIEKRIITNIALASVAFVLVGFFMISTAITLYAIIRLLAKTRNQT
jgi:glycosyltransferase involved in cell wall biosynthesis